MRLLARQDLPGLADLAHRVKGGALIIRAKGLIAACEALESACRGGDRPLLAAAVDEVRQAMDQLPERLQAYVAGKPAPAGPRRRSEAHTSELQSLMRISYAVFRLKKKRVQINNSFIIKHIHNRTNHKHHYTY